MESTGGNQHIMAYILACISFVEYFFHGNDRSWWYEVEFWTVGDWKLYVFASFINRRNKETTFFPCKSSVSLPKDLKASQIHDLGKCDPVVLLFLQMFLSCIIIMDSKTKTVCSLLIFILSFCFYILDNPNTETRFKNGTVTFITDFYHMCLNKWYVLYLWEFSVWFFLVYWIPGTLKIAQVSQEINQQDPLVFPSYRTTCIILLYLVHTFFFIRLQRNINGVCLHSLLIQLEIMTKYGLSSL